jgi:hypothetical protein
MGPPLGIPCPLVALAGKSWTVVKDPGERTSIAQGSYLNFVSRKLVRVSPLRKAGRVSAIVRRTMTEDMTDVWRRSHPTETGCLSAGLEVSIRTILSSFSNTLIVGRLHVP